MNKSKLIENYMISNELDLKRIIEDFEPYIKAIINKIVGNNLTSEDKEEIIADTFFVLWKNKNKNIVSLDSYISGITRILIKEKLRKKKITYNIADFENVIETGTIDMFYEQRQKIDKFEKKYRNLNNLEIEIINMFYYSEKSIKEIAQTLNLSESNIKSRLFRIRKKIKKEFTTKQ